MSSLVKDCVNIHIYLYITRVMIKRIKQANHRNYTYYERTQFMQLKIQLNIYKISHARREEHPRLQPR